MREPERERVARLTQEIARLRSDLEATETVLSEAEAGLARDHSRADAVSSLATTRIEIDRAISLAPWREAAIEAARNKLDEAELQIADGHFGVALFFVHRARHVAETIRDEAVFVARNGRVRFIRGTGIILRAGPSTDDPLLAQLTPESIVIPGVDKKASGYA